MRDVGDEEALVVGFFGADAHAAAAAGAFVCIIDTEITGVAVISDSADQTGALGCVVAGVGDEAVSWVGVGERGEVAEESVFLVIIGEDIAC